jgi:phospholipase/lecithinase/hemolysin
MAWIAHLLAAGAIAGSATLLIVHPTPPAGDVFDEADLAPAELYVLGDSLSDTGNAAAVADFLLGEPMYPEPALGLCNPIERLLFNRDCSDLLHRRSRISDGPVAAEHLAWRLGQESLDPSFHTVPNRPHVGTNYAVAGGKARGSKPQDLDHQLERLLLDRGPVLPHTSRVLVMIGGNDAIDALQAAALPQLADPAEQLANPIASPLNVSPGERSDDIIAAATHSIAAAVSRLLDSGAPCVLVANVPSLAMLPVVRDTARKHGIDAAAAEAVAAEISNRFNAALSVQLDAVAFSHPNGKAIVPLPLDTLFSNALEEAHADGFNVADACFDSETYADLGNSRRRFHSECAPSMGEAPRFERFFFWDGIHPSGAAHAAVGEGLISAYRQGCDAGAL